MAETRQFSVSPSIIYSQIYSQAGTLAKGILEYAMNSVDSGSNKIDITIDADGFVAADDGAGFNAKKEIEEFFEVLAFDHSGDDTRVFGVYGIGRAQCWSFASTVWRTGTHSMDVDIKNRGLNYILEEGLERVKGCTITGKFYEPMTPSELAEFNREFSLLAKYAPIDVFVNGAKINTRVDEVEWDIETDDAFIKFKATGGLQVFNRGVLVREYHSSNFGTAGVVVTKKTLTLNNKARNDVLRSKCEVFKRIVKLIDKQSTDKNLKKVKLTDGERQNLIDKWLHGELGYEDIFDKKLIIDVKGRAWPVKRLENVIDISVAPERWDQKAESLHQRKICWIISIKTLEEFGCESIEAFAQLMFKKTRYSAQSTYARIGNLKPIDFDTVKALLSGEYTAVNDKELSQQEYAVLKALRAYNAEICHVADGVKEKGYNPRSQRKISIGVSDVAEGWTDGSVHIYINRQRIRRGYDGQSGFVSLVLVMLHEYMHDLLSAGSHEHDHEFYERFHDAAMSRQIGVIAQKMAAAYVKNMEDVKARYNKKCMAEKDLEFKREKLHEDKGLMQFAMDFA
jgi:hypothetical protein